LPLSMTGFGEAHCLRDGLAVAVEVRTVNNRYFKLSTRISEGYAGLEPHIEEVIRQRIRRGTVQVSVRVDRARRPEDYRVNVEVLDSYRQQIERLGRQWQIERPVPLESLLMLPGVVEESPVQAVTALEDWPLIREALEAAIERMDQMRLEEGRAMAADLKANCAASASALEEVALRAPKVIEAYRARLQERLKNVLAEFQLTLDPADLIREVSLFGERSDISEEVVRLRSHLDQFRAVIESQEGSGRKLEFLTQEMFREANTIGSKANDVEIARRVIEIKAAIERMREMIQNIE
jgi:uncharacterized protein (TIGR00255 family)